MTPSARHSTTATPQVVPRARRRPVKGRLVAGAAIVSFALPVAFGIAPPPSPTPAELLEAYLYANAQSLTVASGVDTAIDREEFSATVSSENLAGSTNYDWARLVLAIGGWPSTESNVTVFVRWMRQENGTDNWWNRNNPLNNGWGSGGGGGLGSYDNLLIAAQNCAAALKGNPGYSDIIAGFANSSSTSVIEHAIWASPWATSHYANGAHWSSSPVPEVVPADGAW
jgi:hypothetical protein